MGDGEEPQRSDILHRPDEAEVELSALEAADDVTRIAAGDMHAHVGTFSGNASEEGWQHANGCRIDRADPDLPRSLAIG
jgi:hypothetical protein